MPERMLIFDGLAAGAFHYSDSVDPVTRSLRELKFGSGDIVAESGVPDAARVIARRLARVLPEDELKEIKKAEAEKAALAAKAAAEAEARLKAEEK